MDGAALPQVVRLGQVDSMDGEHLEEVHEGGLVAVPGPVDNPVVAEGLEVLALLGASKDMCVEQHLACCDPC